MELKIIEVSNSVGFEREPLTYRISLSLYNNKLELKREYFRVGYRGGENIEGFFFDSDKNIYRDCKLTYASYLTRKHIDDKDFLKKKEIELFVKFTEKVQLQFSRIDREYKEFIKEYNKDINTYNSLNNLLSPYNRKQKLKKIMNS